MICVSEEACEKNQLKEFEVFQLLAIGKGLKHPNELMPSLINRGYVTQSYDNNGQKNGWRLSNKGVQLLTSIVADSSNDTKNDKKDAITQCAMNLKSIFPKGKKAGTNYYWSDGAALIVRRLKLFFKKYGDSYSFEQIEQAAKNYVASFNNNYSYMKLLKYFIFKEKLGKNGDVEGESELLNLLENGNEQPLSNDWMDSYK